MTTIAYDNFTQSIRSKETLCGNTGDIEQFLLVIKDKDFEVYLGHAPKSWDVSDLAEAYVELTQKNIRVVNMQ